MLLLGNSERLLTGVNLSAMSFTTAVHAKRRTTHILAVSLVGAAAALVAASPAHGATVEGAINVNYVPGSAQIFLKVEDSQLVISRNPTTATTDAEVETLNKTAPKVTCQTGVGTATAATSEATGTYVNESGELLVRAEFDADISVGLDLCTLTNSTYASADGTTVIPVTAAGKNLAYGDPVLLEANAKKQLLKVRPAVVAAYKALGAFNKPSNIQFDRVVGAIQKNIRSTKIMSADNAFDASSTKANDVYVIGYVLGKERLRLGVRLTDGRLVVMYFNARTRKNTFETRPFALRQTIIDTSQEASAA